MDPAVIAGWLLAAILGVLILILRVLVWGQELSKTWEFQLIEIRNELERLRSSVNHIGTEKD